MLSAAWLLHARGAVGRPASPAAAPPDFDVSDLLPAPDEFQERMAGFGPRWENLSDARFSADATRATASLAMPGAFRDEERGFFIHPALLDNATGFLPIHAAPAGVTRLPFSYGRVVFREPVTDDVTVRSAASGSPSDEATTYSARITDQQGRVLVEAEAYALRRLEAAAGAPEPENAALALPVRGALDSIRLVSAPRPAPGQGEIEIEVRCSGLNFIETLFSLGLLPEPPGLAWRFGLECSGIVARVGPGVEDYRPGDRVMAFSNGASRLFMIAPSCCVAPIPDRLSFAEAATLPAAYMTAWTALVAKGRLESGETVLVHSAAGGVGLAAVNIARANGAEVLATAGTEEKRAWLRSQGIRTVMDSRTAAFGDEALAATKGRGVDLLLNSLGGEMIERGLATLAPGGRFLELGKRDIFAGTPVSLKHFAKMISFIAIDVGPDMDGFEKAWREVVEHVAAGDFPPLPHRLFPATEAAAAFAEMARGRHIGRLLLDFSDRAACLAAAIVTTSRLQSLEEITGVSRGEATPSESRLEGTAATVARAWSEVLGRPEIGLDDDFFALQGDSLLGAQVVARLRKTFGVPLPVSALFSDRTVAKLADRIDALLAPAADEEEGTI